MNTLAEVSSTDLSIAATFATDVTPTSWQPSGPLTFDEWEQIGNTLLALDKSVLFWIGDWLNFGEAKWGEMYAQAEAITGWNYNRLARAKWVSSKVPFLSRRTKLSWTAHLNVAHLPVEEQRKWLDKAEADGLHASELRKAIKAVSLPRLAPTSNDYSPHADDLPDDVPFSASALGIYTDDDVAVMEYENNSGNDLPMLSRLTFERVQAMIEAALDHRWLYVEELAEVLKSVFLPVDKMNGL